MSPAYRSTRIFQSISVVLNRETARTAKGGFTAASRHTAGYSTSPERQALPPRLGGSVFFLLLPCAATFGLGTWQLQRWHWKKELLQLREERLAGPPVPLMQAVQLAKRMSEEQSPNEEPLGDLEYRQVDAVGRFEKARSIFVGPRTRSVYGVTEKGFQVITPFVLSDESGEPTVLVNRGWVPATWQEERETEATASADTTEGSRQASEAHKHSEGQSSERGEGHSALVRIRGVVRQSESPSSFVPPNSPETGQWFYIHIPQIARDLGLPDKTILVDCVREKGQASTFPSAKEVSEHVKQSVMPEKHLSYAATWFTLSAAITFLTYKRLNPKIVRRRQR